MKERNKNIDPLEAVLFMSWRKLEVTDRKVLREALAYHCTPGSVYIYIGRILPLPPAF